LTFHVRKLFFFATGEACPPLSSGLTYKYWARPLKFDKEKRISLFTGSVSYKEKRFKAWTPIVDVLKRLFPFVNETPDK
jgi:hypothetical protein